MIHSRVDTSGNKASRNLPSRTKSHDFEARCAKGVDDARSDEAQGSGDEETRAAGLHRAAARRRLRGAGDSWSSSSWRVFVGDPLHGSCSGVQRCGDERQIV